MLTDGSDIIVEIFILQGSVHYIMAGNCPHCGAEIEDSKEVEVEWARLEPCGHKIRIATPARTWPSFP